MEWLASGLHDVFEVEGMPLFGDPWAARDAYGRVVAAVDPAEREAFVAGWLDTVRQSNGGEPDGARAPADARGVRRALELLEMERNALRLFTSCAWFFDDVGGVEPRQVLRYAERAIELSGPAGAGLRAGFVERLEAAVSSDPEVGTAARIFEGHAEPTATP